MPNLQEANGYRINRIKKGLVCLAMSLWLFVSFVVYADNSKSASNSTSDYARDFNHALLAELYLKMDDAASAINQYSLLVKSSHSPKVARRATIVATRSSHFNQGVSLAKQWVKLVPDNLEARQYLALLLLRVNKTGDSSRQLKAIYKLVEESKNPQKTVTQLYSEGLKFIGAMLLVESQHEKALKVFNTFLEKNNLHLKGLSSHRKQQYLIQASLTEKAKKYHSVISYINQYETQSLENERLNDIILMKVKALQAVNRQHDAITYLVDTLKNDKKGSDSLKLELVRLFILNKQRAKAKPYLQELVLKYPDNNDLLKSLIALEIDQRQLVQARKNIEKLRASQEYQSDAEYFMAEILEAEGNIQLALLRYQAVKDGGLLKNAKRKISKLSRLLNKLGPEKQQVNYKGVSNNLLRKKLLNKD